MSQTVESSAAALAGSRELLEAVLRNLGDGVVVMTPAGARLYANDEAARLTGYASAEDLLGAPADEARTRFELFDESGAPLDPAGLPGRRALAGERVEPMVVRFRAAPDAPERVSEVRAVPVFDASGSVVCAISFFRDVTDAVARATEQRAARDEYAELYREANRTTALLDSLYRSAPVGLGLWDRDLRYVRVNDALATINERPAEDHVGRTFAEVVPQLANVLEPLARRVLERREPIVGLEVAAGTPNQPEALRHWVASYYPVLADDGEPIGVGCVVEEITDRRHAEQLTELQLGVTRILAGSDATDDAVPRVLATVCETLGWDVATYWSTDAGQLPVTWVRPGRRLEGFVAMTERTSIESLPLPRGVVGSGRPTWLEELEPATFARAKVARAEGLSSGVGFPVLVEGQVVGVLEAFSSTPRPEDPELLQTLLATGAQLGQFLRRKRAEEERQQLLQRERSARAEAEAARDRLAFIAEVSELLGSTLDVDRTLAELGRLLAGRFADWTAIHLARDDGPARLTTVAHADPVRTAAAQAELAGYARDREPPALVVRVLETGEAERWSSAGEILVPGSLEHEDALHSGVIAPLVARSRILGTLSLARGGDGDAYDDDDLEFAVDIARRAAVAIDNAQLYRAAEERAQAARVLASVGDGVFFVDRGGLVRTWNRAASTVTGLPALDVVDHPAAEVIPGWSAIAARIPIVAAGSASMRAESLPLDLGAREVWLSIHGVVVPDGIVYAFRDLTEERALETMRTEFVSTVSHELRTPLAAIYGAAMTLRRSDVELGEGQKATLLDVVSGEADRLARTVNDILWASRLDTDALQVAIQNCDPYVLARDVVDAQRAHLGAIHELHLTADPGLPPVAGDPDKVGRVLINLVDNAVKYSPEGGRVDVAVRQVGSRVRFSVIDSGLGIPPGEQRRVFEKFYRLDPNMNRGVGGTGLGLYICRELVVRMDGRIWVESLGLGSGSTFHVELPVAGDFTAHIT